MTKSRVVSLLLMSFLFTLSACSAVGPPRLPPMASNLEDHTLRPQYCWDNGNGTGGCTTLGGGGTTSTGGSGGTYGPGCAMARVRQVHSMFRSSASTALCSGDSTSVGYTAANACNAPLANSSANATASGSGAVQQLLNALAAKGILFQVVDGSLAPGTAAQATVNYNSGGTSTLTWDKTQIATAVANGQSSEQILFMELEHIYLGALGPRGSGGRAMSILAGQTPDNFTLGTTPYSLDPSGLSSNGTTQIGAQYPQDQHLRIHDDLVGTFGEDKTAALAEATGRPANDKDVLAASKTKLATATSGLQLSSTCSPYRATASSNRHTSSIVVDDGTEIATPASIVYDAIY